MKQQILYYLGLLLSFPLLPFLYRQGRWVRSTIPKLPQVEDRHGSTGAGSEVFRLVTLGESTVAGVGMPDHHVGFTGCIARQIAERTGKRVEWTVLAQSGLSAKEVTERLAPEIPTGHPADLVVIGLGGNDTFRLHSPLRWRRDMIGLISAVRRKQPGCPILIASMPPVHEFPAFPWLTQRLLGAMASLHRTVIRDLPDRLHNVQYASRLVRLQEWVDRADPPLTFDDLFCDGVHPSARTYEFWSEELVDLVIPPPQHAEKTVERRA